MGSAKNSALPELGQLRIDERRQHILSFIQGEGRVLVDELSRNLSISHLTVRLQEMHADIVFLGVDGFDPEVGVTTPNLLESRVKRAMVETASRVVAVCDSTKFKRRSHSRIIPPSEIHCVITDRDLPSEIAVSLEAQNIEVILV